MKRYDILEEDGGCCPIPELKECTWGGWVRYEDHTTEVERLRRMLDAALDDNWEDIELTAYRIARSGWTPN